MEQHTVEVTFEGEKISSITDEHGTATLCRTPEDTYFVHSDMRHIGEGVARITGRDAVLEQGRFPKGIEEDFARRWWPQLFAAQSVQ